MTKLDYLESKRKNVSWLWAFPWAVCFIWTFLIMAEVVLGADSKGEEGVFYLQYLFFTFALVLFNISLSFAGKYVIASLGNLSYLLRKEANEEPFLSSMVSFLTSRFALCLYGWFTALWLFLAARHSFEHAYNSVSHFLLSMVLSVLVIFFFTAVGCQLLLVMLLAVDRYVLKHLRNRKPREERRVFLGEVVAKTHNSQQNRVVLFVVCPISVLVLSLLLFGLGSHTIFSSMFASVVMLATFGNMLFVYVAFLFDARGALIKEKKEKTETPHTSSLTIEEAHTIERVLEKDLPALDRAYQALGDKEEMKETYRETIQRMERAVNRVEMNEKERLKAAFLREVFVIHAKLGEGGDSNESTHSN